MRKLVALLFMSCAALAQPAKQIDSLLRYYQSRNEFMGSVVLRADGKTVIAEGYGFANADKKTKASKQTLYKVGSITKIYTAAILMQLVEEGKVSLEEKLSKFYPQIDNADKITIEHLLSHRSGIFNYTADAAFADFRTQQQTKEMLLSRLATYKSQFEPGSQFSYCNSNYILLGFIIEDITGKSYEINLKKRILKKAKLRHTFYAEPIDTKSYTYAAGKWVAAEPWDMSVAGPAGALVATASDIVLFLNSLFDGKIVSPESLERMLPVREKYGLGVVQVPYKDVTGYGHTGSIEEFITTLYYFPSKKTGLAICSNAGGNHSNAIAIGMLALQFGDPYKFPDLEKRTVDPLILAKYKGIYTSPDMPLIIEIKAEDGQMIAQATGQSAFALKSINDHEYSYAPAGLTLLFKDEKMILKQGGGEFTFTKQN